MGLTKIGHAYGILKTIELTFYHQQLMVRLRSPTMAGYNMKHAYGIIY
ncbi:hypothetical protein SAMN04489724_2596 [Algoriphagus locisalis]|uniref:Uncharacterized protein n=1 Tax=Algoriphagus locisalis TaxID=305507 RepID=A0A1I7BPT2_9BACT|nr:hypothetical protein [Algoriphagus locisalis]SFT89143.1 hypothetical protein SAMN04489724_2596 [Algoriphagus locisalis]